MEEFDTEVYGFSSGIAPPKATHCDIPLKFNIQRTALGIPSEGQYVPRGNKYKKEWDLIKHYAGSVPIHRLDLSHCQRDLLNFIQIKDTTLINTEWKQQLRVSEHLWKINIQGLKSTSDLPTLSKQLNFSQGELNYLYHYYKIKSFWEEATLSSGSHSFKPNNWWTKSDSGIIYYDTHNIHIYLTENLILVKSKKGSFLAARDHLLIISDLASQRYLLRFLCIREKMKKRSDFPTLQTLNQLLDNGDLILEKCGNSGYEFIYTLEPLCISYLVGNISIGSENGQSFYQIIQSDCTTLATKLNIISKHEERNKILNSISESPIIISQIYGLYRIWGHPTLEPLEGTVALKNIVTVVRPLDIELTMAITNKFKEEFIMRYIKHENKWPTLNITELSPTNPLREAYTRRSLYPKNHINYKRSDLSLVKFCPQFPIDPKFDLVEVIADKAMSLCTPDLIDHLRKGKGSGTSIERSVLVQWLESSLHDPKEFLSFIDQQGFTIFEKSVGVKEKEREGKIKARLFGLMTLVKRMYIVLTEALLSEHILTYFPEITMMDDEISLDKKRIIFTSKKLTSRALFTSLDFSKWNSNMREAETLPLFQCFDQLFGFNNCFTKTHEMFKDSFIYLLNGSYIPQYKYDQFIPDLGSWYGHLGGIEGLRQKGWTIWTVSLILYAAEDFPISLRLMGQGDNQVLREIFPEEIPLLRQMEIHYNFLTKLDKILSRIGLPLKKEETWTSRELFVYGKYLVLNGSALPMYGKRVCRMFRLSNEDYPTIESTISSLTANYSAAVATSYDPGILLFLYYIELIGTLQLFIRSAYLQNNPIYLTLSVSSVLKVPYRNGQYTIPLPKLLQRELIQPDIIYEKMALLPRCFGGLPVSNIFSTTIRGFPDEVSFAISSLKTFYPHCSPELQKSFINFLSPMFNPDLNYNLIFEHPTSLNLMVPPAPSEARRNAVIKYLKETGRVQNPYLKTFLSLLNDPNEQLLIEFLSSATPFCPRILSMIVDSTVEARARHIAGKLQKTKTISTLARLEGSEDIYSLIIMSEINHFSSVLRICTQSNKGPVQWNPSKCSVQHAKELRNYGWKKVVEGVDCVPPQEFLHIELTSPIQNCNPIYELDKGMIVLRFSTNLEPYEIYSPLSVGAFMPYRGSITRQKTMGFGDKLSKQADPLLQKILKAFSLLGLGIKLEGNLASLVQMLLEARTDLNPLCLMPDEARLTGSVHHRLQDSRTGHGGSVSILPNYATKFGFDTFPLTEYTKGSINTNLMFQSIMSYSTVLTSWALSEGWINTGNSIHLHVKSSCCINEINETLLDCPNPPPPCVYKYADSPYLYTKAEHFLTEEMTNPHLLATADLVDDSENATIRLINLMAEEIFSILSPHSWDISEYLSSSFQLVINWCSRLPLLKCFELLTLKLCAHYLGALKSSSREEYLIRLAERIDRSPVSKWSQLSNLIFSRTRISVV